jgi:hypothetical protein
MSIIVADETESNTKFNSQPTEWSRCLDIDEVNFLYRDVTVSGQILDYSTNGYEFCDVDLDSA